MDPNVVNSHLNMKHINFDYKLYAENAQITETVAKQQFMRTVLIPELELRDEDRNEIMGLSYTGKIELLQTYLIKEEYLSFIFTAIDKSKTTREAALVLTEQCIPCSLHIDLQITEKSIKYLLQEGLNDYINNNNFVSTIENFINN